MSVVVNDEGFGTDDWADVDFLTVEAVLGGQELSGQGVAVDMPNDCDPADLAPWLGRIAMIRVAFPATGDGRALSIARRLRAMGYAGKLRARGPMIVDQVRAARRVGFDEIELPQSMADRQPSDLWVAKPAPSYRDRVFALHANLT